MNRTNNQDQPPSLDGEAEEARIRRALGLQATTVTHQQRPEQARQRHRFVADGAVPVVMLNRSDNESGGLKEKLSAIEFALETERAQHAATRRSLQEANAANQALQTRLAHTELAHNEVLTLERNARRAAEEALAALQAAPPEPAPQPIVEAQSPEPKRRGRKPGTTLPKLPRAPREDKPVRWWTPSYRAKRS